MSDQRTSGHRLLRQLRSRLVLILALVIGLPMTAFALFVGYVVFSWSDGDSDVLILIDEAREQMVSTLRETYGVTLDPADRIVEAHRTSGGMQGDGTNWYLIRLGPASATARHFEADFTAHARVKPTSRDAARRLDPTVIARLGWESGPPRNARVFDFNDRVGTIAVFFDDKFLFYFLHF